MWEKSQYQHFIKCLMQVHQWETSSNPLLSTIVGRHIYLCIISELSKNGEINVSRSLKQIFLHPTLTDRAIRLKLRDLESQGYIVTEINETDGRTKSIKVTDKFFGFMDDHNRILASSYRKNFLLFSTDDPELQVQREA